MAEAEQSTKPPKDIKKLLGFLFAGVNLLVVGFGAYLVFISTLGLESKKTSNDDAERELKVFEEMLASSEPVLYTLQPFNTNLEGLPRRLIRLDLSLEMMDEEGFEEVIGVTPQARDSIMRILNSKTFGDVETVQGKLQLKNEIVANLNSAMKKGVVKNVYFNELVVQ